MEVETTNRSSDIKQTPICVKIIQKYTKLMNFTQ